MNNTMEKLYPIFVNRIAPITSPESLEKHSSKNEVIMKIPEPKDIDELLSFLGMIMNFMNSFSNR